MKKIAVVLIGCGGVGRHLLDHILSTRSLQANQGVRLRVVGVCDSRAMIVAPDVSIDELGDELLSEVCRVKYEGSSLETLQNFGNFHLSVGAEVTKKITHIGALLGRSTGLVFVDCSASLETIGVLNQAVESGCCVVLANKKPLTSSMEDYDKLVSQKRRIRHESTVGAGLPVIASLNRLISSGDPIYRVIGSLSGTLGYVMSEVEDGKSFSQVVNAAKSLGYTEPDPRDDLSGMDVARKALILARLLGRRVNMDSMKIESLYPEEMGPEVMSVEDFLLNGLPLLDKDIQQRIQKASLNGNVLRYVCLIDEARCQVGIQEVSRNSALGRLRGSDNVLEVYSRCYSQQPLVIQGAGAGNDTTAAGVLADILDMQDLFHS
ncbi:hypothetical protein Leryth_012879 [Lithospermum erythrorhizon]|nr:hypothetical protein Leryth_012879 [Lithospermum erythrorhizon]